MPTPNHNKILRSVINERKRRWNAYQSYQKRLANYIMRMQAAEVLANLMKRKK